MTHEEKLNLLPIQRSSIFCSSASHNRGPVWPSAPCCSRAKRSSPLSTGILGQFSSSWRHSFPSWGFFCGHLRGVAGYGYYFASLALLLAIESKEMALTMPIIWLSYDLLVRKNMVRRMSGHWILPNCLVLWYGLTTASEMRGVVPTDPYYMNISASTLVNSFGIYFNMLFGTSFQWGIWCIGFVVLLLVFALLRNRLALFFQSYIFIAFLPVIFLINHLFAFYCYLPFLGVSD